MMGVLPWLLGVLSGLVLIVGAYFFQGEPEATVVKLIGWTLFALTFLLAGPRLDELMKLRRRQVEERWEKHPGNPSRGSGDQQPF